MQLFILASFASSAFGLLGLPVYGPFRVGPADTTAAQQMLESAGRHPNATNTVSTTAIDGQWSWTINVTDVAVPDRLADLGQSGANYSSNLRFTNTEWQLQWPGSNISLQAYLASHNVSMQVDVLQTHLSNATNGNCSRTLGDQCASSLQKAASESGPLDWNSLKGCDSLRAASGLGMSSSIMSNSSIQPVTKNSSFFYFSSAAYPASNRTIYDSVTTSFNVLALRFDRQQSVYGNPGSIPPIVLCQVVKEPTSQSNTSFAMSERSVAIAAWILVLTSVVLAIRR